MLCPCVLALLLGASNPHLDSARQLVKELKYPEAAAVLAKARDYPGNERAVLIEVLWLQGLVAATLGRGDDARGFFRLLCSIDPDFVARGDPPPKVMGPFFEAKGWAASMGKLKFEALPPAVSDGKITGVSVAVTADPLKLAKRIRFRLKGAGASWYVVDATLAEPRATIAWAASELSWCAELLGDADAVVANVGSLEAPLEVKTQSEVVTPPPPPPPTPVAASKPFFGPLRVVGVIGVGAGIALAAVGGLFASNASAGANQIKSATRDASGTVTSLTQREAFSIDQKAQGDSTIATGLFVGAGVLGAGGVVLFVFGNP